jgi:hypothetical protein
MFPVRYELDFYILNRYKNILLTGGKTKKILLYGNAFQGFPFVPQPQKSLARR